MQRGSQDEDAALISAISRGQEPALARLISRHGRSLAAIATRYLGNRDEADDVVQEVFLRVWSHADRFDPARARPTTWIYAIAVRLCIDRLRKLRVRRFFGLGSGLDPSEAIDDTAPGTETSLAARQDLQLTRTAIAALPDRQRMAILLCAVAGLDTARIAETLDISAGAVEQLLVRARRTLRSQTGRDT